MVCFSIAQIIRMKLKSRNGLVLLSKCTKCYLSILTVHLYITDNSESYIYKLFSNCTLNVYFHKYVLYFNFLSFF